MKWILGLVGILLAVVFAWFFLARGEFSDMHEWSILQSLEFKFREEKNEKPYMLFKRALDTDSTVVGFPVANSSRGYVMLLTENHGEIKVKSMPQEKFVVTRESYNAIKAETSLSIEVDQFIQSYIK